MAQATRTFRIFVSSTFSDLKEERNALQKEVFPRLKKLCRENGTRFQGIDLRWGVREEAGLDQRTMAICLDEIERCRNTSPRPNFIVLLGDRYGWRPLPAEIPKGETRTYIWIANKIGSPGAARAVGSALAVNPFAPTIPCHRVIRSDGQMGGYSGAGGVKTKLALLREEGFGKN